MRRREFITLLGGAAAWPLAARAQRSDGMRRIALLMTASESDQEEQARLAALREGLGQLDWMEGRNLRIDYRWTADLGALERSAKDLVALQPDLILTDSTPSAAALARQTSIIPIVFVSVVDPVGSGLVSSLSHPGRNITGFLNIEGSIASRWVQLLKEIAPRVARAAFLFNPATAPYADYYLKPFNAAAASFAVAAIAAPIHDKADLQSVIVEQARQPNAGLLVMPDTFLRNHRAEVISLAARHRVPAVYPFRYYTEDGGLLSYGTDAHDLFRRAASYVDRILRGTPVRELPVQAPVKFELVINLKTAKAVGLEVPATLLARADEVIE